MSVKPVVAPIVTAVPAPAKFSVVTPVFTRLNVLAELIMSPPLTARSPVSVVSPVTANVLPTVASPPTRRSNPTAAPPRSCNAPVAVLVALVTLVTVVTPEISTAPLISRCAVGVVLLTPKKPLLGI